jgi:outer membrane protein OmpA-like peptidoglycan-associated protein
MKKVLITLLATLIVATVSAQEFNADYKYKNILSNVSIGGSISYNRAVFTNNSQNVGADLRFNKRIHDNFRIRAIADVNGFLANGFDRYGKGMLGVSLDFMPFYMFFDYGANYNPNNIGHQKFGLAGDAGIGLGWDYFHIEAGVDRTNNGNLWQSNAFAKVGFDVPFALPEKERVAMSMEKTMRQEYGNLRKENKELKDEIISINEAQRQLQDMINQSQKLLATMEQKVNQCQETNKQLEENCTNKMEVYFEYAMAELSVIEETKLIKYAEQIIQDGGTFSIEGYCSNNGDPFKNKLLSERRAEYVFDLLSAYGVSKSKMNWIGNGMTDVDDYLEQKVIIKKVY